MTELSVGRRRFLRLHRNPAIGWDLPEGHHDDPAEASGRAALTARYLAHALSRDSATAGWIRRHRLTGESSEFSFWSPESGPDGLLTEAIARVDENPPPALLRALVTAQLAQARTQRNNPLVTMFRSVESAAWGDSPDGVLGDQQSLDEASGPGFAGHLRRCFAAGKPVGASTPAAGAAAQAVWRGDVVTIDRPGEQCRLIMAFRLAAEVDDAACVALLAQLLDGSEGLLYRRLRIEAGLVYGTVAVAKDDGRPRTLIIGCSLLREGLPMVIEAFRLCVDEIDSGHLDRDALGVAAGRVADRMLTKLDEPFGALDDKRRRLGGGESIGLLAERVPVAVARLAVTPRLDAVFRPAIGYVGPVDDAVAGLLGRLR